MNNKRNKKRLSSLLTFSLFGIVVPSCVSSSLVVEKNNSSISMLSTVQRTDVRTGDVVGNYTVSTTPESTGLYADQITESMLESVLSINNSSANGSQVVSFNVSILPVTETNLNEGSVDFLIYEITKNTSGTYLSNFASSNNNQTSNISQNVLNLYSINNNNPTNNNVFSTKNFNNLNNWILKKEYRIDWKSDEEIKQYILSKDESELKPYDVWVNLIDNTSLPPFKDSNTKSTEPCTKIEVSKETSESLSDVGLYKIVVTIENGSSKEASQNLSTTSTRFLGGFNKNGISNKFELKGNDDISNWTVSKDLFDVGDGLSTTTTKISDLTPSEFVSPNGGNEKLISILASGEGLNVNSKSSEAILKLQYGNKTINFVNKTQSDSTAKLENTQNDGFVQNTNDVKNKTIIKNLDTIPNDIDGSLKMIVSYESFDVYSGKIKPNKEIYEFPAGTFKSNVNYNPDLLVTWKSVDSLNNMNYSHEVVNEYYKNRSDEEFVREFSNRFINASESVKKMKRTVEIDYGMVSGNVVGDELQSSADNTVRVKLTFEHWGTDGDPFEMENIFVFDGYKYGDNDSTLNDVLTFQWKSNEQFFEENKSYSELSASQVALNMVSENDTQNKFMHGKFVMGDQSQSSRREIILVPNDIDGTMMVYMRKNDDNGSSTPTKTHLYQQLYVGFKPTTLDSSISSFAFLPQSDVNPSLLSIPLVEVTKDDVMELFLKDNEFFANGTLTEDDVEISANVDPSNPYLEVVVTINTFDQSRPDITIDQQRFTTIIKGFSSISSKNLTVFNPPKDLTAVISIVSATVFSVSLGVVLIGLLLRRAGVKVFKNNIEKNGKTKNKK